MVLRNLFSAGFFLLCFAGFGCEIAAENESKYTAFKNPERVTVRGYEKNLMEPFLTRDGKYLFFNNSNNPKVNTNLHYATRIDDLTFQYKGEIEGVNTDKLEGVATMDRNGNFYFVSTRSYFQNYSSLFQGKFSNGKVKNTKLVSGVSEEKLSKLNFDLEVSADGKTLYFVDGVFTGKPFPDKANIAIAIQKGGKFERLKNSQTILKNINTDTLEYAPCISANQLELFFTRLTGKQKLGIFRATRKKLSEPFGKPELVSAIKGFVEAPTLSPDEKSLYYHKKEKGKFVLYRVKR